MFSYPKYRILEMTDQFGSKRYYPQIKKSFFADLISWLIFCPFEKWRCLAVRKDDGSIVDCGMEMVLSYDKGYCFGEEIAKSLIKEYKNQKKEEKARLLAEKIKKAKIENEIPKFKTTKKTYV